MVLMQGYLFRKLTLTWKLCDMEKNLPVNCEPLTKTVDVFFCFPIFPFFLLHRPNLGYVLLLCFLNTMFIYIYVYIYNIKILYIYIVPFPLYFSRICHAPAFHVFRTLFPYVRLCLTLFNYSFCIYLGDFVFYGFINFYLLFLFFICIYLLAPPIRPPSSRPPVLSKEWSDEWPYTDIQHLSLSLSLSPSLQSIAILNLVFVISICFYLFHSVSNIS